MNTMLPTDRALLSEILEDPGIATAEGRVSELSHEVRLFPEEESAVARAIERRRRQYAATRHLARQLFQRFGLPPAPVLNHADRSPIWPTGFVGSITHTDHWCGVALAPASRVGSLGIDAEARRPLRRELLEHILTSDELDGMASRGLEPEALGALWFSAKESVYKCAFPQVRRYVGFAEVALDVDFEAKTFAARPVSTELERDHAALFARLRGRFVEANALWITAVVLPLEP